MDLPLITSGMEFSVYQPGFSAPKFLIMSYHGGNQAEPIHSLEKLHFVLSAKSLPSRVRGSTGLSTIPDPYAKVWWKDSSSGEWEELARTKHVINKSDPHWMEVISFDWKKSTGQAWRVDVLDYDVLGKDDLLGSAEIDVDTFVLFRQKEITVKLGNGGSLTVKGTTPIQFRLEVEHLPKLDTTSGSDPFVECFWSIGMDGERTRFHKTETVKDAFNAKWDEVIEFNRYQPGTNQFFTFKVSDDDMLKDDTIGSVAIDIDSYMSIPKKATYRLNDASDATISIMPVQ